MELKLVFSLCRALLSNPRSLSPVTLCGLHTQERDLEARKGPWCLLPFGFAEQCECVSKPEREAVSSIPSLAHNFPKHLGFGSISAVFVQSGGLVAF